MELKYGVKISLLIEEDGGGYFVEVPDLKGCSSDAETIEKAIEKINKAIDLWIKVAKNRGMEIPKPTYY